MEVTLLGIETLVNPEQPENAPSPMLVTPLPIVTLVNPEQPWNAWLPMEVTGRLSIVFGMTKEPEACGLEPVIVISTPSLENNNSANREVEEKRRRERMQAEEFLGMGKRMAKIAFIWFQNCSMACVLSTVF